jgi:hypothetical protein
MGGDRIKTTGLKCQFCGDNVVLGEQAQSVTFSSGVAFQVVHARRCKDALIKSVETGEIIQPVWRSFGRSK